MKRQLDNERGVVLVTALMVMALLTVIGISALNSSDTELKITGNQRVATQAFYLAEAGIQHAVGVFRTNDVATLESMESTELTKQALGGGSYSVDVDNLTDTSRERVELRSTGKLGTTTRTIEAIFERPRHSFTPDGAFGVYGDKPNLTLPNNKQPIDGRDWDIPTNFNCSGAGCAGTVTGGTQMPGLYVSDTTFTAPNQGIVGSPPVRIGDGAQTAEDWKSMAAQLIPLANKNPQAGNLGTRANPTISYFDKGMTFTGNGDGAGILIVEKEGNLNFKGTFHYEGIIIVLNNGGIDSFGSTSDLFGAVIMVGDNMNAAFGGNGMVKYSSKAIENVRKRFTPPPCRGCPVNRVAWREATN
ncbi:MAG: pilus assembly PilX family protein [Trichloromonadaceae bacterium]